MRRSNFALRLQPSLLEEARKAAESEGVALNQLINVAVAEKVSALRTQEYFVERARRANRKETFRILDRAGRGNLPIAGDELPAGENQPSRGRKPARKAVSGVPASGKRLKKRTQGS
jgi:HicB family